jgi:diaminopimelate epimerase
MIFYKTSSFGNDFIEVDAGGLPAAMPRRPHGATREPKDRQPHGGLPAALPRRPQGASRDPQGELPLGGLARAICDRQRGVGADGVVLYKTGKHQTHFQIFNRDGGEAELSGNGMAGLAAVLLQRRLAASPLTLKAAIGQRRVELLGREGPVFQLNVEIGGPDFADRGFFPFLGARRQSYRCAGVEFHPVSVGNPHAVVICPKLPAAAQLASLGKKLESHPMFPKRVNVEFAEPTSADHSRAYFYERGVGPTQSSSTGSAAVFAVLRRLGLAGDRLVIDLDPAEKDPAGGDAEQIQLRWNNGIFLRNITRIICRGEYFL